MVSIFPDEFIWSQTLFEIIVALGSSIKGTKIAFLLIASSLESMVLSLYFIFHQGKRTSFIQSLRFSMETKNLTMKKVVIIPGKLVNDYTVAARIAVVQEMK